MPVGRQADKLDFTRGYMICLEGVDSLLWAGVCLQKNTESKGLAEKEQFAACLLYTSPSPRDVEESRMPSSA